MNKPLTLHCNVTTMTGVNTRVDIIWDRIDDISNKKVIRKVVGANSSLISGNKLEYRDSFTIAMLNESHNGIIYQCTVTINYEGRQVLNSANVSLEIFSKYNGYCIMDIKTFIN